MTRALLLKVFSPPSGLVSLRLRRAGLACQASRSRTTRIGFDMGLVQRSRGGDALRHSAYVCGGSARLADGSVVDFSTRNDVVAAFVVKPQGSPAWAADCAQLWKRAVAAEKRADAQEARLFELTIPRSIPKKYWMELARHVARAFVVHGMTVQVGIHCPMASDGDINPHIHFMTTMREIVDGQFSRQKARHWNKIFYGAAKTFRYKMAEMLNEFCRRKGVDCQVDPRSNVERGLPAAEIRLPHWHVLHYKRTGQKTPAMEQRDKERAARSEVARLEAEYAELERELEAARAEARMTIAEEPCLADPPQSTRYSAKNALPGKLGGYPKLVAATAVAEIATDLDLPISRYGP
ncbi:MobA/MobL family protein [Bradyrhizobium sp. 17]|uniref:MobA/MobL family protein n=1 Tax=Bradyrhizobium sp. 17 TaxID=2782649 RepID=UPI001FFA7B30|nr:MobA/MobL family protein [Bradyrhizobium sp. 17]MCK1520975.1 MobA/MobL family protein [Bradyrhizobium sp. 17]